MDDDENNIFSDSQNFYPTQNFNPSQNFSHSQDYFPSFDGFPNSVQYQSSFQNISQNSSQDKLHTNMNASNTPHGWSEQEDIALMFAWCFVSTNAIVGTNQTSANLWQSILDLYEQSRIENPGWANKGVWSH
ncbi:glutathione S-transferase T3-like [Salvia divinorum]|uniref:Glutathione S-transferase T3-like n=1 Tax=Salvia divinorum TaxID=28513 RepID=A0ABD1HIG2_SALDI